MKRLTWIVTVLLLATFSAGTAAHAAATTDMSLRMALVDIHDCDGCDETSDAAAACQQSCIQPFVALPVCETADTARAAVSLGGSVPQDLAGHVGPPERHPPR